jgi:hypothetical protein
MTDRLRDTSRRTLTQLSPSKVWEVRRSGRVPELRRRVAELEAEMQESRRLNRRLAELMDIVQELLVPIAQRDEKKINEYLERYSSSL